MERMLIPGLQELVRNVVSMSETVRAQRSQCKMLAELLKGLTPLLQEIQGSKHSLTEPTVDAFRNLMHELIQTQKVMKKMKEYSKLKLFFKNPTLTEELSEATTGIQACLSSLPLVQLRISVKNKEEIKQLKLKLGDLIKELKDCTSMREDQQDLAAEITEVLRAHNTAEASTSGAKVMDKLVLWLAQRFDSDVDTVRSEWEVVKEEALSLREQIEYTSETKRQLEEELLQTLVYIDSEERQCATCASRNAGDFATSSDFVTPVGELKEFMCSICLQLLVDPVIIGSGFTYCRKCITNWFEENDTCPITRKKLITKTTIGNITLRNVITRWREAGRTGGGQVEETVISSESSYKSSSSEFTIDPLSVDEFINEERGLMEQVYRKKKCSPPSPSTDPRSPVKSVTTYLSLLGSHIPMQVLKSLKQLTSIASFSKGQAQFLEAGGIPAVAHLLERKDNAFAEKAAGVLEVLTCEIKGDHVETYGKRDQICSEVVEVALDNLIDLMQFGSNAARMNAAQTVINILADEEIRAEVVLRSGVVSAFYALIGIGQEFLFPNFPNEGKELCVKGLNLLAGEKATGSTEGAALATALLRLAALGASSQVVEESLLALRLLVEAEGESICKTLVANKAIPFLVRSISRLPSGRGREDALKILNEVSRLVGMPEVIVKYELFFHLLPVLNEANHEGDCSNEATRLLNTCLSSVMGDISQILSQADLKGLVGLLCLERTSVASKADIVSSLHYLCRESSPLRGAFLSSDGIARFLVLVNSVEMIAIKEGVAQLIRLLASFPTCRRDICNQGGMQLVNSLLKDDSFECCSQAVVAAEFLMTGPEASIISFDGFPFKSVVDLLGTEYELECREAAAGVLSAFAASDSTMVWDRNVIELLLDMVRPVNDLSMSARKKAAAALLTIARQDSSSCLHFLEDGLPVLIEFGLTLGTESRAMIVQLLSIFCQADGNCKEAVVEVGGINILLEALEKGRMKEESAVSLGHLVESVPARKAVLQAGFIDYAIRCIQLNGGSQCALELTRALLTVIDSKADAVRVRESKGIQALVLVLEASNDIGKRLAASALAKLIRLDQDSSILLGDTQGIYSLCKFLMHQQSEASLSFNNVEALDTLRVASEEQNNKIAIVQELGIPLLISISATGCPRAQELALKVLLNLSLDGPAASEHDICGTLLREKICTLLFDIVRTSSQLSVTEKAVYSAICMIRNLSLRGVTARTAMLEEGDGAVKVLLDRIRHHEANSSADVVRGAVIAIEKFMSISRGKMALIREDGIRVIVQVLHHRVGNGQAKTFATKILVMLAQDPQASREVCHAIYGANVIPGLRDILELGPSSECKLQACILLKFLMYAGPRAAVCKSIRDEHCIPKLLDLRSDATCYQAASDALDLLKTYDKESRKQITAGIDHNQRWTKGFSSQLIASSLKRFGYQSDLPPNLHPGNAYCGSN